MSTERSPEEIAAERLLADPGLVQRRLDRDLAAVAEVGRTGVQVDPRAARSALVEVLRSEAGQLEFDAPIEAATQTKRRLAELPTAERRSDTRVRAYYASASTTVRKGSLVNEGVEPDGTRTLVFRRQAAETPLAIVTLAAEVLVGTDGRALLESYGWPTPPNEPVHAFTGAPEALLDQALTDLADSEMPLDRALLLLWGARLQAGGPVGDGQKRIRVAELVAARLRELNAYLFQAEEYASSSGGERWYSACLARSVLENLFESYLGGATFSLVDAEDIDDVDEELRDNLPHAHAAPGAVPSGVPDGHWWWNTAVAGR